MNKYNKHFKLNLNDSIQYILDNCNIFKGDAILRAEEIGDGNINYIFRIEDIKNKKSVVLKQADKFLRSSGRKLNTLRIELECEMLQIERNFAPSFIPEIFYFDKTMGVIVMEDISDYTNLRNFLLTENLPDFFSTKITDFLVDTLLPTTDLVLDHKKKKGLVKKFINKEMCEISEIYVFSEPYTNTKKSNNITKGNLSFVEKHLYGDKNLHLEVGKLKNSFMTSSEALIHGDLHSGSIFVDSLSLKIIDPEFAFYGPIGYDVGNVIGNLFFPLIRAKFLTDNISTPNDYIKSLENSIVDIISNFKKKFKKKATSLSNDDILKKQIFIDWFIFKIISDSLGYAGLEIIRRVIGDAKVLDLTSIKDTNTKIEIERVLILIGIKLIKEREILANSKNIIKDLENIINR